MIEDKSLPPYERGDVPMFPTDEREGTVQPYPVNASIPERGEGSSIYFFFTYFRGCVSTLDC
jgi:hypothetical protein